MKRSEFQTALKSTLKWALRGLNPFHNFLLKLLSIGTALIALFFIAGQPMIEELEIPIYLSPPSDLATAKPIESRAVVRILASSTILNSMDRKQVFFDFKNVDFREGEVFINLDNHIKTPPGIQVAKIVPPNVHMIFEKKEIKEVPMVVRFQGTTPKGYEYVGYEISPRQAKIEGAKSVLNMINYLETEPISLVNRTETFAVDAPLKTENLNIFISNGDPITITVAILKNPRNYFLRNIPITVESEPKSYSFYPQKINTTIACAEEFSGKVGKDDVSLYIDLKDAIFSDNVYRAPIRAEIRDRNIRESCFIKSLSYRRVTVTLKKTED
jgi:YbbR domain-containing protein